VEKEDEDEEEDKDEDDGKERRTIGQGEMLNTTSDDADTMGDDETTVLPEQTQEMREDDTWPQTPASSLRPQTLQPSPPPRTLETHTLSGLEFLWVVMPQKPRPAAPTRQEAEAARNTSDFDVEQQILSQSAGGDSLPNVPLPGGPLPDVPLLHVALPNVALPSVALPNVTLPEASLDGSVGEE
jgi:hypothetical protein